MKKRLTQSFFNKLFGTIISSIGIQKNTTKKLMKDPYVKKEMEKVQKSMQNIQKYAEFYDEVEDEDRYY